MAISISFLKWTLLIFFASIQPVLMTNVGVVWPMEQEVLVGDEIVITCTVNTTFDCHKDPARGFRFEFENKTRVEEKFITHINSTAIELRIPNAFMMHTRFLCFCDRDGVDYGYVFVDTPPKKIVDFNCIAYNFDYLYCNFTEPESYIQIDQQLQYTISFEPNIYNCLITSNQKEMLENEYSCNITQDSYYPVHQYYNFTLTRNNTFGVLTQNFIINHNDRLKLSKPNLTLENATHNSLRYLIKVKRKWLPNKYYYEVEIKYATEFRENRTSDRTSDKDFILYGYMHLPNNADSYIITLDNLPYAYAWYDVRIRCRIRTNEKDNTMWSDTFNITSQTSAKLPDRPPKTDIGSFFIDDSNRKVNLYWETLAKYEHNGKNLDYIIKQIFVNNRHAKVQSIDSSLNAVAYEYNSTNKYEFHIKSINEMGESADFSVIKIPARTEYRDKDKFLPKSFNKILHNNSYELTWDEPDLSNSTYRLKDYTVFWCKPAQEIHTDCEKSAEGFIHFQHVDKNERFYTKPKTNITHNLNFGVSANYEDFSFGVSNYEEFSSGIVWAPCTGQTNSDFEEIQILSYTPDKQSITIFWSLNCVMSTIIKGYNLTYCIFKENLMEETMKNEPNCSEPEISLEIPKNKAEGKYVLENLKPHKQYKININIYSDTKSGPKMSKPVYYTTLEAAPSTPKNLRLVNKTSNYAVIQWDAPENKNGIIKNYEIHYNENSIKLDNKHFNESDTTITYKLEHLRSFYHYKVYVTAYTVASSNSSNDLTFQTWIGTPDSLKPGYPNKTEYNNKKQIVWEPPHDSASSKVSFYKVTIQLESNYYVSYVEQNQCTLKPVCSTFKIMASAVNAIPNEQFDYERFEHSQFLLCDEKNSSTTKREQEDSVISYKDLRCEEHKNSVFLTYCGSKNYKFLAGNDELIYTYECSLANKQLTQTIFLSIAGVLGICFLLIFVLFGVKKFRKMKNIDFELPPGLADLDQLDPNKNFSQDKPINEKRSIERANENLRLLSSIDNVSNPYINCSGSEKSDDINCGNDNIDNDGNFMRRGNSLEMVSDTNSSNHSSRSQSPNMSIGSEKEMAYILPQNDSLNRSNNNISINDGYVQQSLLENSIPPVSSNNGYSTIEALQPTSIQPTIITNPIQNMPVSNIDSSHYVNPSSIGMVTKPKVFMTSTTNPQNPTLAGYVTHKQLSDYGQQKRH